jgi:hypothetical protein
MTQETSCPSPVFYVRPHQCHHRCAPPRQSLLCNGTDGLTATDAKHLASALGFTCTDVEMWTRPLGIVDGMATAWWVFDPTTHTVCNLAPVEGILRALDTPLTLWLIELMPTPTRQHQLDTFTEAFLHASPFAGGTIREGLRRWQERWKRRAPAPIRRLRRVANRHIN